MQADIRLLAAAIGASNNGVVITDHLQPDEPGEHCQVEIRNYKKDDRLICNELMISPVRDQDGNITNFGVQNDITGGKKPKML